MATGWISIHDLPIADNQRILVWHVYGGALVMDCAEARENRFVTHWREIDRTAWIWAEDRKPTQEDADKYNCVISLDAWGRVSVAGWHRFYGEERLTGWQHAPEPPEGAGELRNNAP